MKKINENIKTLILYSLICLVLILVSCIGIFFKVWEVAAILALSSLIVFPVLYMNLYSFKNPNPKGLKASSVVLLSLGRVLLLILNIVIAAVLMKFTNGIGGKYRLLYVLLTFIPVIVTLLLFYINSKKVGEDTYIGKIDEALKENAIEVEALEKTDDALDKEEEK